MNPFASVSTGTNPFSPLFGHPARADWLERHLDQPHLAQPYLVRTPAAGWLHRALAALRLRFGRFRVQALAAGLGLRIFGPWTARPEVAGSFLATSTSWSFAMDEPQVWILSAVLAGAALAALLHLMADDGPDTESANVLDVTLHWMLLPWRFTH
jgi:hypothetical protein